MRENLLRLRNYGLGMANHARLKRHQVWTEDYAIINGSSFRYKLLTYYMSKDRQVQQLKAASFEDVKVFDLEGRQVQTGVVCSDRSLHYIARKRS